MIVIPAEEVERIASAVKELNALEERKLKPLYEKLEERFDYVTLSCVCAHLTYQGKLSEVEL